MMGNTRRKRWQKRTTSFQRDMNKLPSLCRRSSGHALGNADECTQNATNRLSRPCDHSASNCLSCSKKSFQCASLLDTSANALFTMCSIPGTAIAQGKNFSLSDTELLAGAWGCGCTVRAQASLGSAKSYTRPVSSTLASTTLQGRSLSNSVSACNSHGGRRSVIDPTRKSAMPNSVPMSEVYEKKD